MSNLKVKRNKYIFGSIEEINAEYGVELVTPVNIPEGSNLVCYTIEDLYNVKFAQFYREDDLGLFYYNFNTGAWYLVNETLEKEILEDFITFGHKYIYLRLTQQGDCDKTTFTPERLLGVETTGGYIKDVHFSKEFDRKIITVQLFNRHWYRPQSLNFYISDDSDETVSFDEYVKLFYNTDNTL